MSGICQEYSVSVLVMDWMDGWLGGLLLLLEQRKLFGIMVIWSQAGLFADKSHHMIVNVRTTVAIIGV